VGFTDRKSALEFEHGVHMRFSQRTARMTGEWFESTPEILSAIDFWPDAVEDPIGNEAWSLALPFIVNHAVEHFGPLDAALALATTSQMGTECIVPVSIDDPSDVLDVGDSRWSVAGDITTYGNRPYYFVGIVSYAATLSAVRVCGVYDTHYLIGLDSLPAHMRHGQEYVEGWKKYRAEQEARSP
jgi:hypothetical protein